jgi:hypothetical protein
VTDTNVLELSQPPRWANPRWHKSNKLGEISRSRTRIGCRDRDAFSGWFGSWGAWPSGCCRLMALKISLDRAGHELRDCRSALGARMDRRHLAASAIVVPGGQNTTVRLSFS